MIVLIPIPSAALRLVRQPLTDAVAYLLPRVANQIDAFPTRFMEQLDLVIAQLKQGKMPSIPRSGGKYGDRTRVYGNKTGIGKRWEDDEYDW